MTELYLFAFVNAALCAGIVFISVCRLNAMRGATVLVRVQSEYAGYIGGAVAAGLQPWWNEWPQWGSLGIATALLLGLLFSGHAWRKDKPPATATAPAPLSNLPEIHQ
jgi:hypothetical protein